MEQVSNCIGKALSDIELLAIKANPEKSGDWRDGEGILHCGKCGKPMECITKYENIKKYAFVDDMDYEHQQIVEQTMRMLSGKKHRIPCRCKQVEREQYEKAQKKEEIKENCQYCFGKSPNLFDCVFELDDNPQSNASQVSRKYANDFKKYYEKGWGLVYVGDVGHGKTYYACAIANKLLYEGWKVKYTTIPELVGLAQRYYIPLSEVIDGLCYHDLIIIDDLGAEEASDKMQANTYQIFNALWERKKSVIITSNISANELKNAPTDSAKRIYSRILDRATIVTVTSEKGDRRIKR